MAADTCPRLAERFVGRGGVQADLDQDGRVDLVILVHGGEAIILQNVSEPVGHWLKVILRQEGGNRFALGARLYVTTAGKTRMAEVGSSSSYLSQDDSTLHFGIGEHEVIDSLRIVWPDGAEEVHEHAPADRTLTFTHDAEYPL